MPLATSTLRAASGAALAACVICAVPPGIAMAPFDVDVRAGPDPVRPHDVLEGDPADRAGDERSDVAARVTLGPGGRDIRLAGDLMEGVAARVQALLDAHPDVERIHLTSDGGLVDEAVALGASIAGRGLDTYVPDACASACTLAFVRGRRRYLLAGAGLGFHAPYEEGQGGAASAVDAAPERAAYLAAGVEPSFVARALAVPPDDIWIPDATQLQAAGVVTEIVGSDRFPDSILDADPSPGGARAVVPRAAPVLARVDGDTVEALAAWYPASDPRLEAFIAAFRSAEAKAHVEREFHRYPEPAWWRRPGAAEDLTGPTSWEGSCSRTSSR